MQTVQVCNASKGTVLGDRIHVADTSITRMVGLLGRKRLEEGSGLLIYPSQAVHTVAMRFPIDVLFIDKSFRVIHVHAPLAPNRISSLRFKARCVLELPAGMIVRTGTAVGDELQIVN